MADAAPARLWQQVEGAGLFLAALGLYGLIGAPLGLWWGVVLFFLPDLSFAAYAFGARAATAAYNLAHLYAGGALLATAGVMLHDPAWIGFGLLWLAHCGFDRMLGYGLKLPSGFNDTHLGPIGRNRPQNKAN